MIDEKQRELHELTDEVEIILSVKDNISHEEIDNLVNKFHLLLEYDIRKKIEEITGDSAYIKEFIDKVNEETSNVKSKNQNANTSEVTVSETNDIFIPKNYEVQYIKNNKEVIDIKDNNYDSDVNKKDDNPVEDEKKNKEDQQDNINISFAEETIVENKSQDEKIIFSEDKIPEVSFVKADIKYGQLSLEWGWPEGINKVLICYRMDKFPMGPTDSCALQVLIKKEGNAEIGDHIIHKVIEGNYYFCIYIVVDYNEKRLFSDGQRRLVVNKTPSEIFYEIKRKRNLLGKLKGIELSLSTTDKEINLPQLVLVGKFGNMPLQKSDGKSVFTTDYQTISNEKSVYLNIPIESISPNMYVKLFFLDDSNSKLYRIISPAKEKLYFK